MGVQVHPRRFAALLLVPLAPAGAIHAPLHVPEQVVLDDKPILQRFATGDIPPSSDAACRHTRWQSRVVFVVATYREWEGLGQGGYPTWVAEGLAANASFFVYQRLEPGARWYCPNLSAEGGVYVHFTLQWLYCLPELVAFVQSQGPDALWMQSVTSFVRPGWRGYLNLGGRYVRRSPRYFKMSQLVTASIEQCWRNILAAVDVWPPPRAEVQSGCHARQQILVHRSVLHQRNKSTWKALHRLLFQPACHMGMLQREVLNAKPPTLNATPPLADEHGRISRDARQFDILLRGGGTEHLNHVFMGMQQLLEAPTSMAQLCEAFVESSGSVCQRNGQYPFARHYNFGNKQSAVKVGHASAHDDSRTEFEWRARTNTTSGGRIYGLHKRAHDDWVPVTHYERTRLLDCLNERGASDGTRLLFLGDSVMRQFHQDFLWKLDQHNWLPDGAKVRPGTEFVPMTGSSQPLQRQAISAAGRLHIIDYLQIVCFKSSDVQGVVLQGDGKPGQNKPRRSKRVGQRGIVETQGAPWIFLRDHLKHSNYTAVCIGVGLWAKLMVNNSSKFEHYLNELLSTITALQPSAQLIVRLSSPMGGEVLPEWQGSTDGRGGDYNADAAGVYNSILRAAARLHGAAQLDSWSIYAGYPELDAVFNTTRHAVHVQCHDAQGRPWCDKEGNAPNLGLADEFSDILCQGTAVT